MSEIELWQRSMTSRVKHSRKGLKSSMQLDRALNFLKLDSMKIPVRSLSSHSSTTSSHRCGKALDMSRIVSSE